MSDDPGCPRNSRWMAVDFNSIDPWYGYRLREEAGEGDQPLRRSRIEDFFEADMLYDRVPPAYFERPGDADPPNPYI